MSRKTVAILGCIGIVGTIVVAALIVFAFRGSETPPPPATDAGIAIDPSPTDPAGVATSVMSGVYTWQPAVQDSPWDALHAQRDNLSGQMATAAATPPDPMPQPIPEWAAWSRGNDTVTSIVRPAGETAVAGDTATVPVTISQTVQHKDGSITPYLTLSATVHLENRSDTWTVSMYRLTGSAQ
jgi:hypothetical protein